MSSVDIVVKILLKYFNPATEDELSQSLGIFFEKLIECRKQELLQEALLPTINAVMDAPNDSPLAEIEYKTVIRFVIQSTRPEFCASGLSIHDTIAMSFLSAIKDMDFETNKDLIRVLVHEMNTLEISGDNILRENFKACIDELIKKFDDSKINKGLLNLKKLLDEKATPSCATRSEMDETNPETVNIDATNDNVFKVPSAPSKPSFMDSTDLSSNVYVSATPEKSNESGDIASPLELPATQQQNEEINETLPFSSPAILAPPTPELPPHDESENELLSQVMIPATQDVENLLAVPLVDQDKVAESPVLHMRIRSKQNQHALVVSSEKTKKREHPPASSDSSAVNSPVRKTTKSATVQAPSIRTRKSARDEQLTASLLTRNKTVVKSVNVGPTKSTLPETPKQANSPKLLRQAKSVPAARNKSIVSTRQQQKKVNEGAALQKNQAVEKKSKTTATELKSPNQDTTTQKTPKAKTGTSAAEKTPIPTLSLPVTRSTRITPATPSTPKSARSQSTKTPVTPKNVGSRPVRVTASASTTTLTTTQSTLSPATRKTRSAAQAVTKRPTLRSAVENEKETRLKTNKK